jgi:predicted ATPase
MTQLRIKNFGPLRDGLTDNGGWIEFKKVTVFIGNQGSGKSCIAKIFSTFAWIEKVLTRGDYDKKWFERKNRLRNQFLSYHRLENYLELDGSDRAEIEYIGASYAIRYASGQLSISEVAGDHGYHLPQVMYVPAERNFIAYVRNPKELKLASESLKEFLTEFDQAKLSLKGPLTLPINRAELEYDKLNDLLSIKEARYKLRLTDASSGFQSFVPLYLVTHYLANLIQAQSDEQGEGNKPPMSADEVARFKSGVVSIFANDSLTEEQKRAALSALSAKFNKTAFINIVEEPEQNLFPASQWQVLQSLLAFNNQTQNNKLVMTTHSPYIVNFISIVVQAQQLLQKIKNSPDYENLRAQLQAIVHLDALVAGDDLAVYQLDETTGSIQKLSTFDGIPTDHNYLNEQLRLGNDLFDQLLAIEEAI